MHRSKYSVFSKFILHPTDDALPDLKSAFVNIAKVVLGAAYLSRLTTPFQSASVFVLRSFYSRSYGEAEAFAQRAKAEQQKIGMPGRLQSHMQIAAAVECIDVVVALPAGRLCT